MTFKCQNVFRKTKATAWHWTLSASDRWNTFLLNQFVIWGWTPSPLLAKWPKCIPLVNLPPSLSPLRSLQAKVGLDQDAAQPGPAHITDEFLRVVNFWQTWTILTGTVFTAFMKAPQDAADQLHVLSSNMMLLSQSNLSILMSILTPVCVSHKWVKIIKVIKCKNIKSSKLWSWNSFAKKILFSTFFWVIVTIFDCLCLCLGLGVSCYS